MQYPIMVWNRPRRTHAQAVLPTSVDQKAGEAVFDISFAIAIQVKKIIPCGQRITMGSEGGVGSLAFADIQSTIYTLFRGGHMVRR